MSGSAATGDSTLWTVANAATDACFVAGCFPPSIAIGEMIPAGVGGPFAIGEACGNWKNAAATLQNIQQNLDQMCTGLPSDAWEGDDRDAFNTEVKNLLAELGDSHNTAEAIGITLEVLVPVFPLWITEATVVAGMLAIAAAAFYAAAASGIGDVTGVAEELYAMGLELSESCLAVMNASRGVLIGILAVATASLTTATIADVVVQTKHGDSDIDGDLGQATVDGLGQDITNALVFAASSKLDKRGNGGIEHSDPEGVNPSAMTGYRRGMEQVDNLTNRLHNQVLDKGVELGTDLGGAGETIQDGINYVTDRTAPEPVDLEETAKEATGEE